MAGIAEEDIEAALIDLEAVDLVDDERFARELAAHEVDRRLAGRRAALASLRKAGVARDMAERAVEEASGEDEEARAEELARSRVRRLGNLPPEVAYRRLLGFLQRRGYDGETARAVCRRVLGELEEE
jgi:regulatory protein